ncbi:MAG: hypothetical protein WCK61_06495 [Candidatus Omnitrophota bacterium]
MEEKVKKEKQKKGFFARLFDKLDKKMEEKSKSGSCGCKGNDSEGKKSCCS